MANHSFTVFLSKLNVGEIAAANALYEAGCSDALFGVSEGVYSLEFDREAESEIEAIGSAIHNIQVASANANLDIQIMDIEVNGKKLTTHQIADLPKF